MTRDDSQLRVIASPTDSSALVVAPPGYGKTYVMTRRIQYLHESGSLALPKRLLGLTFTNAAAAEMNERVRAHTRLENVDLCTIHAFCYQALYAYGRYVSVDRDFSIVGDTEIKNWLDEFATGRCNNSKDLHDRYKLWTTERILKLNHEYCDDEQNSLLEEFHTHALNKFRAEKRLHFDHVLLFTLKLFRNHSRVLELYRRTYSHILVDEFQDTNPLQFEIISLLVDGHPDYQPKQASLPVFFFGDREQSIYQFLGATPDNIDKGIIRFNCTKYDLKVNHRTSSQKILTISRILRKEVAPSKRAPSRVELKISTDENAETRSVIDEIRTLKCELHRVCVIAPNQFRLQALQVGLAGVGLPFVFIPDYAGSNIERQFPEVFRKLRTLPANVSGNLENVIRNTTKTLTEGTKTDIIRLMINLARDYDARNHSHRQSLAAYAVDFANHLLLEVNWGHLVRKNIVNKVFVSTIHGVKGLEFDHVILCGLENYVIPHSSVCVTSCSHGRHRDQIEEQLAEYTRLLYVGVTRSVNEISLYSIETNKGKKRKISCLLHSLESNLASETDLASRFCGFP